MGWAVILEGVCYVSHPTSRGRRSVVHEAEGSLTGGSGGPSGENEGRPGEDEISSVAPGPLEGREGREGGTGETGFSLMSGGF